MGFVIVCLTRGTYIFSAKIKWKWFLFYQLLLSFFQRFPFPPKDCFYLYLTYHCVNDFINNNCDCQSYLRHMHCYSQKNIEFQLLKKNNNAHNKKVCINNSKLDFPKQKRSKHIWIQHLGTISHNFPLHNFLRKKEK